ncbi:hypothetical protein [Limosilactobacillus agrestimuris]|uniref:hypothetical protein n=1 Tax=Limosilactobacillus agrestimuris TaxID=2941331 RepID=UPI00203EF655|nr:hypothetical protein [Limosilactobacillus agrestimuris]
MTDYYVIDDKIYGHYPIAYKYSELIKALNNANIRHIFDFDITLFDTLVLYQNVKSISRLPDGFFKIVCDSHRTIYDKELTRLLYSSNAWYQNAKAKETWDGQMNYLAQSNLLGNPVFVPFLPTISHHARSKNLTMRHPSHSSIRWKNGRVGHTMSANARYTHWKRELITKLDEYPITHHNRKDRRHQFRFPVFDDDEYCFAKHSTGWKYSTKHKHQYEIHQ